MAEVWSIAAVYALVGLVLLSFASSSPLLNPSEIGFNGQTRDSNYDALVNAYFINPNVASSIATNTGSSLMWVPWYKTSSSSQLADLQSGVNCNAGQTIDFAHNCMVTDEFSQLGVLVSMGKDQDRMNQFYNTVLASKSANGNIPGWKVYRDGNTVQACKQGVNGNCDTASDGTARIVIALFTASKNAYMPDAAQKSNYAALAKKLADDMISYEMDTTCRPTSFGTSCYWLAAGSISKSAGISSTDFAYAGYYPDAIIAMLEAYANTNDMKYYNAARDLTLNYLQAAKFNNQAFSVPPGKSFKWVVDSNGVPQAQCTNTCSPAVWDGYDAPRALGMCEANYYAQAIGVQLPNLPKYCSLLTARHMSSASSSPVQFYPDGSAAGSQSGYFAQGLEALHLSGVDPNAFKSALDSALSHFSAQTHTFDYAPSMGVYTSSFAVRALGLGIGRDMNGAAAPSTGIALAQASAQGSGIASLAASCAIGPANVQAGVKSDSTSGGCRTLVYSTPAGDIKTFACEKTGGYIEIYAQAAPSGVVYKSCLANGCVTNNNGFASFQPLAPSGSSSMTVSSVSSVQLSAAQVTQVQASGIVDVSKLQISVTPSGSLVTDVMDGLTCRKVQYNTPYGWDEAKVCSKGTGYELYLLSSPNAASICVGSHCVGQNSGFISFTY